MESPPTPPLGPLDASLLQLFPLGRLRRPDTIFKNSLERFGAKIAVFRHKTGLTRHSLSDHCASLKSSWKDWILMLAIRGHEV